MTIQEELAKYYSGLLVECKILSKATDGYNVAMGGKSLPGVLPTSHEHQLGSLVLAQFIEVQDDQALLHELSNKRSSYERLRDALKEEQALTASLKFKRATDLLVPPVDDVEIRTLNSSEIDFGQLCRKLENEEFTGCIKSFNQERFSRAGAILNSGRVVGCIYGNKSTAEALPVKESLDLMRADAIAKGAEIRIYELPEDVVMALAALFLGCPLMRSDSFKPEEYITEMRHWLQQHKQTACFACSLQTTTWLDLHYDGEYAGTFCVEDQKFYRSEKFLMQKLNEPNARVEMALLSPELGGDQKTVGLALSDGK